MANPRYLEKFESADGVTSYVFPLKRYEWQSDQDVEAPVYSAIGADYGYDPSRFGNSALNPGRETVRALIVQTTQALVDTELDNMRSKLYKAGRGKLWALDAAGVRRWAYARADRMPSFKLGIGDFLKEAVTLSFTRFSPWYQQTPTAATQVAAATPVAFNITNPGNQPAYLMQFRFRSNVAIGWTQFTLTNTTNNYAFTYGRAAASANDECRIDTERLSCERSVDDGVNYTDDFANLTIPATQVQFMRLEPGVNAMSIAIVGGTPNINIDYTFYGPNL